MPRGGTGITRTPWAGPRRTTSTSGSTATSPPTTPRSSAPADKPPAARGERKQWDQQAGTEEFFILIGKQVLMPSVVDPHHLDAEPDSTYHPDANPDSTFHPDVDLDPTFHPDADPDPDPSFKKSLNP